MNKANISLLLSVVFWILGSVLMGLGTNMYIGFGVFFLFWAVMGIMEIISERRV